MKHAQHDGKPHASRRAVALGALALALACAAGGGAAGAPLGSLDPVPLARLSERSVSKLGEDALAIRPRDWLHAETDHFVYHYFSAAVATPVSVEAEFYYRVFVSELERDASRWERKCHIFVFQRAPDWDAFRLRAHLDPWTGGIQRGGELFLLRIGEYKFKGPALGHEVAHLVTDRFFGAGVPLWLHEGWAEYASGRAYASFYRARGYIARPMSRPVPERDYVPLARLTEMMSYPAPGGPALAAFYAESERLVRFLCARDKPRFLRLFNELAQGRKFESALRLVYGTMFTGTPALELEFKKYVESRFASDAR